MTPVIEVECEGRPIRIRLTPEGPEFLNYDIEHDITLVEMGYDPTECYTLWHQLVNEPYSFYRDNGFLPESMEASYAVLTVSIESIKPSNRFTLEREENDRKALNYDTWFEVQTIQRGYLVSIPDEDGFFEELRGVRKKVGYSKKLIDICAYAVSIGVFVVEFADDAPALTVSGSW
jgi:hypothetical protein